MARCSHEGRSDCHQEDGRIGKGPQTLRVRGDEFFEHFFEKFQASPAKRLNYGYAGLTYAGLHTSINID